MRSSIPTLALPLRLWRARAVLLTDCQLLVAYRRHYWETGGGSVNMEGLIEDWKLIRAELEQQLVALGPPAYLQTRNNQRNTTEESKLRVRRCITELDQLLRQHGEG